MAIKGLSTIVMSDYEYNKEEGKVTYSNPTITDHAIEYSLAYTLSDDNPLYADNKIQENDQGTFQSGELTLGTADMPQDMSKSLLGIKIIQKTYGTLEASEGVYDDTQKAPFEGVGLIETHQIDDTDIYRAVFLTKARFSIPEEAATTKGESVEWQTKEITGTVQRSDEVTERENGYNHPWMIDAWFSSEADATEWLMYKGGKAVPTQLKVKEEKNVQN